MCQRRVIQGTSRLGIQRKAYDHEGHNCESPPRLGHFGQKSQCGTVAFYAASTTVCQVSSEKTGGVISIGFIPFVSSKEIK